MSCLRSVSHIQRCGSFPALYRQEDFRCFDQYADGDSYEDPAYRTVFRTILQAISSRKPLFTAYSGKKADT